VAEAVSIRKRLLPELRFGERSSKFADSGSVFGVAVG